MIFYFNYHKNNLRLGKWENFFFHEGVDTFFRFGKCSQTSFIFCLHYLKSTRFIITEKKRDPTERAGKDEIWTSCEGDGEFRMRVTSGHNTSHPGDSRLIWLTWMAKGHPSTHIVAIGVLRKLWTWSKKKNFPNRREPIFSQKIVFSLIGG